MRQGQCTHRHTQGCYTQLIQCVYDTAGTQSGNDEDTVSEDSEKESEAKTNHICSEASGCIIKILQCTHVHNETCGYFGTPKETSVISWEWVDDEELLIFDEQSGTWGFGLPGASRENPLTAELLADLLPQNIDAKLADGSKERIPIAWKLSDFPEKGLYEGQHTLSAAPDGDYVLDGIAPKLEVLLDLGGASTTAVTDKQLESHIVTNRVVDPQNTTVNLFNYGVTGGVSPGANGKDKLTYPSSNPQHNRDQTPAFLGQWGANPKNYAEFADWNKGINKDHFIIFGDAQSVHSGLWNKGAGAGSAYGRKFAGMEGIVSNVLGDNGYPVIDPVNALKRLDDDPNTYAYTNPINNASGMFHKWEMVSDWKLAGEHSDTAGKLFANMPGNVQNLSKTMINNWEKVNGKTFGPETESLAYLFDPTVGNGQFKNSYTDVKGFFQLGEDGYYYYNMRQNFAEFSEGKNGEVNRFILYDAPATTNSLDGTVGNFLPFNKGSKVFAKDGTGDLNLKADGTLDSNVASDADGIDHYFGLTVETQFRQPIGGKVSNDKNESKDMTFEFSGDDDVWVFVDDVLVLDLGGVHSEIYGTINFSTGDIYIGRSFVMNGTKAKTLGIPSDPSNATQMVNHYKLKDLFEAAGRLDTTQWTGDTFASHTDHKIKLFYLERGNYDSSLTLRFNLVPRLFQQIKKVDQDGSPLEGVGFDLYAANEVTDENGNTAYETVGAPLTSLVTDANGMAQFKENTDNAPDERPPFNFSDRFAQQGQKYYILRETITPQGYRKLPTDIILEFDNKNSMLTVKNRYQSGSYASFISTVVGNNNISYGAFDPSSGTVSSTDKKVSAEDQRDGLVVAIPMLYEHSSQKWKALYGSNVTGLKSFLPTERTAEAWREACLTAMLWQCSDTNTNVPKWYLEWNTETQRLEGTLSDLPGMANRYVLNNPENGDMRMMYALITPDALKKLGINHQNLKDGEVYDAIGAAVNARAATAGSLENAVAEVRNIILGDNGDDRGFYSLNTDQFNRSFRSLIYIPNERRELRVWKVDQNGKPVNGVEFTISSDQAGNIVLARGRTANVDGRDGVLIFTPSPKKADDGTTDASGYSRMMWAEHEGAHYYLRETDAPEGFELNPTVVPIEVGIYSIYADAGDSTDGITVMTEVGKLAQTMKKYASDEEVNITLRDITATAQTQPSGQFTVDGWTEMKLDGTDKPRSLNLHYGKNARIDYGIHDEDGGKTLYPYFVTDQGFITVRVKQNGDAITGNASYGDASNNTANYDLLGDMDITSLFSLVNIVVVTDTDTSETTYGTLTVSKRIEGPEELISTDYNRNFEFRLDLTDANGNPLSTEDQFYFYGKDKSGYIRNGDTFFLHHDETFTILGLPIGTHYKVTETADSTGNYICALGTVREGVIESPVQSEEEAGQRADFVNVRNSIKFEFIKVDAFDTAKVLPGAAFSLYQWIGEGEADKSTLIPAYGTVDAALWRLIASTESDATGRVYFDEYLSTGTYRLVETKAPAGYLRPKSQWQFDVIIGESKMQVDEKSFTYVGDRNDKPPAFLVGDSSVQDGVTVFELKLPNMQATDLPFTGGRSKTMFMLFGAGLICTASCIAIWYCANDGRKRHGVKKC